ncbi:hypothetical protein EON80_01965 [bacterium]|nr:MAG: hypothetical protein EON80_01965 [bacterium]
MKTNHKKIVALSTLSVLGATTLGGAFITPAHAGSDTWKKVAIGAGAVTSYGLIKGKGKVATIGGLATVGSYLKYRSDKKKEDKEEAKRVQYYKNRYGSNWRNHYKPGV